MDWSPVLTASSALAGAVVGFLGTQIAAGRNRAADKKKRCTDRLVEAIVRLEAAYSNYTSAMIGDDQGARVVSLELQAATRSYSRAVGLIDHPFVRQRAEAYANQLLTHYLFYDSEPDELDADRTVPSAANLDETNRQLIAALRNYESN